MSDDTEDATDRPTDDAGIDDDADTHADIDDGAERSDTEDAPLSDLARDVERRRERRTADADANADVDANAEDLFTDVGVDEIDSEAVWETVAGDPTDEDETEPLAGEADSADLLMRTSAAEPIEGKPNEYVIPKSAFCQRCRFFSEPPAFECTHEGTEIVQASDTDHFHVRNCPMVEDESGLRDK